MRVPITRASIVGACFGLVISVLVLVYGYFGQYIHSPAINDWYIVIACPTSIMLMALDNAPWQLGVVADALVVVTTSGWYAFLFAGAAMLFQRLSGTGADH
jgi:hypothetical protein